MQFSIITPSLNQSKFIEKTIRSVVGQGYRDLEYIVIDGGSTDGSLEIIKKYQKQYPKIIKWLSEKDNGQTSAINKGYRMSTGEILAYLNSDDVYEKNTLKIVADYFKKNPQAKIVYGKAGFIDENGKFLGFYKTQSPTLDNLFKECVISQPSVFMKKEVYENIGSLDESLNYAMDYDYWIRSAKKYKFYFIDKVLSYTRLHKNTKTNQSEKVFGEILKVLKKNYGKVSDEAVFNFAYVKGKNNFDKIKEAIKTYLKYHQIPGFIGLKHFGILIKKLLLFKN